MQFSLLLFSYSQLSECDSGRRSDVERIDTVIHRYLYRVITAVYSLLRQSVALGAEYYSKPLLALKRLVINTYRVICECHCRCFKAQRIKICRSVRLPPMLIIAYISPRDKKYRSHTYSYGSPAKRVTAGRGYQHSVYAECSRRANYCSCVADIGYIFEYGNPSCVFAKLLCLFGAGRSIAHSIPRVSS